MIMSVTANPAAACWSGKFAKPAALVVAEYGQQHLDALGLKRRDLQRGVLEYCLHRGLKYR